MARLQAPPPAPEPSPGTWGDHPPLPDALTLACQEAAAGAGIKGQCAVLESEEDNPLATALARLGQADGQGAFLMFYRTATLTKNLILNLIFLM